MAMRLSALMPAFNETATIEQIFKKISAACPQMDHRIFDLSDKSHANTIAKTIAYIQHRAQINLCCNPAGQGMGYHTGQVRTMANSVLILNRDYNFDYNPGNCPRLYRVKDKADVVSGSGLITGTPRQAMYFRPYPGNKYTFSNTQTVKSPQGEFLCT